MTAFRSLLIGFAACAVMSAAPACFAAERNTPAAAGQATTRTVEVVMTTSLGDIAIELYPDKAPLTVANFLRYVDAGRYAGATFYRTVRADNDRTKYPIVVVQGGIQGKNALPPIAHETTRQTGLKHVDGTISMARLAPGTATSEFFICIGDNPVLDFGALRNADGQGFAAFGRVISGMEAVRKINAAPSNAPTDDAYVRGQRIEDPIEILRVERRERR